MWTSIGFKRTMKTIGQFPATILTPMFSYWVFAPIESISASNLCCRNNSKIGTSFLHSWINATITIAGGAVYFRIFCSGPFRSDLFVIFFMTIPLHAFSVLMLILIQCLDKCQCCPSSCCKSNIQRTLLDVDNSDNIILFGTQRDGDIEMQIQVSDKLENQVITEIVIKDKEELDNQVASLELVSNINVDLVNNGEDDVPDSKANLENSNQVTETN